MDRWMGWDGMDGWKDTKMDKSIHGWIDRYTDGWMDGWMDG
jgi:hypothetical protein